MLTIRKVYKAANWIPLGLTKGYSRVNRQERDFFVPNERPKTVWVYPLAKDAVETLNAPTSRKEGEKGACELPVAKLMLGKMDLSNAIVSGAFHLPSAANGIDSTKIESKKRCLQEVWAANNSYSSTLSASCANTTGNGIASIRDFRQNPFHWACFLALDANSSVSAVGNPFGIGVRLRSNVRRTAD